MSQPRRFLNRNADDELFLPSLVREGQRTNVSMLGRLRMAEDLGTTCHDDSNVKRSRSWFGHLLRGRSRRARKGPVGGVDRLIVHQFDPARPSPGGIDTCLRGMARYLPGNAVFAFVGVDAGGCVPGRKIGRWERYDWGSGPFWFMPVARLDPADQTRRSPHALRLVLGVVRYCHRLPHSAWFQAHRMDTAWSLHWLLGDRRAYFIHTQEDGLTGNTSDSMWRFAGRAHGTLERSVARRSHQVVVFNEEYARVVTKWNALTQSSPTWFDPSLISVGESEERGRHCLMWAGRLEVPKDPALAIACIEALDAIAPEEQWRLELVGSGSLLDDVNEYVSRLPESLRARVQVHGRLPPTDVARLMARSSVFLMTSHPGYEGYPRVLVEALASGLPSVVTFGSDTGNLIRDSQNGFVTVRDPRELAAKVREATRLSSEVARASVSMLEAPAVIAEIFAGQTHA